MLTQRYLGPRFVLDMDDIANEDFWAAPSNYDTTYPDDVIRVFPYAGMNNVINRLTLVRHEVLSGSNMVVL